MDVCVVGVSSGLSGGPVPRCLALLGCAVRRVRVVDGCAACVRVGCVTSGDLYGMCVWWWWGTWRGGVGDDLVRVVWTVVCVCIGALGAGGGRGSLAGKF